MQKIIWAPAVRNVSDLIQWNENPRSISKAALEKLKQKIVQNGFHSVIVIDTDNTILSGNQRKVALTELGIATVNVMIPSRKLSDNERRKIGIESNINDGEWDLEKLKSFDLELLQFAGFDDIELAKFWDEDKSVKNDDFDIEKELKKIKTPKTKLGNVIRLGKHKIICGDSTKLETLKKLLGDERASMIYSDPVYNLRGGVNYSTGISGKKDYGGEVNDTRTYEEYKKFLKDSMEAALAVCHEDIHVFYYTDQIYVGVVQDVYRSLGIANKRVCLWLKNSQNCVPKVFCNKAYEPAVYGTRGRPYLAPSMTSLTEVLNPEFGTGNQLLDQVDDFIEIWTAKRLASKDYEHATSKPITLHEKAIKRCIKPGGIIIDSFLGSGSTLLAAEQLDRRVYGCELEPRFCDLIVKRYEALTGIKAIYEKE
jgi:DNA modification methylase